MSTPPEPQYRLPQTNGLLEALMLAIQTGQFDTMGNLTPEAYYRVQRIRANLDRARSNAALDDFKSAREWAIERGVPPEIAEQMSSFMNSVSGYAGNLIPDDIKHMMAGPSGSATVALQNYMERSLVGHRDGFGREYLANDNYTQMLAAGYANMFRGMDPSEVPTFKDIVEYQDILKRTGEIAPMTLREHLDRRNDSDYNADALFRGMQYFNNMHHKDRKIYADTLDDIKQQYRLRGAEFDETAANKGLKAFSDLMSTWTDKVNEANKKAEKLEQAAEKATTYEEKTKLKEQARELKMKAVTEGSEAVTHLMKDNKALQEVFEGAGVTAAFDIAKQQAAYASAYQTQKKVKSALTLLGHDTSQMSARDTENALQMFSGHKSNTRNLAVQEQAADTFSEYVNTMLYGAKGFDTRDIDLLARAIASSTEGTPSHKHAGAISRLVGHEIAFLTHDGNAWLNRGVIGQAGQEEKIAAVTNLTTQFMNSDMKNIVGTAVGMGIITEEQLANGDFSGSDVLSRLASGEKMSAAAVAAGLKTDAAKQGFTYDTDHIYELLSDSVRNSMLVNNRPDAQAVVETIAGAQFKKNIDPRALKTQREKAMYHNYLGNKSAHDAFTDLLTGDIGGIEGAQKVANVMEMWEAGITDERLLNSLSDLSDDQLKGLRFSEEKISALRTGKLAESDLQNIMKNAYAMDARMTRLRGYSALGEHHTVLLGKGEVGLAEKKRVDQETRTVAKIMNRWEEGGKGLDETALQAIKDDLTTLSDDQLKELEFDETERKDIRTGTLADENLNKALEKASVKRQRKEQTDQETQTIASIMSIYKDDITDENILDSIGHRLSTLSDDRLIGEGLTKEQVNALREGKLEKSTLRTVLNNIQKRTAQEPGMIRYLEDTWKSGKTDENTLKSVKSTLMALSYSTLKKRGLTDEQIKALRSGELPDEETIKIMNNDSIPTADKTCDKIEPASNEKDQESSGDAVTKSLDKAEPLDPAQAQQLVAEERRTKSLDKAELSDKNDQITRRDFRWLEPIDELVSDKNMPIERKAGLIKTAAAKQGIDLDAGTVRQILSDNVNNQDTQRAVLAMVGSQPRNILSPQKQAEFATAFDYLQNKSAYESLSDVLTGADGDLKGAEKAKAVMKAYESGMAGKPLLAELNKLSDNQLTGFGFSEEQVGALRKRELSEPALRNVMSIASVRQQKMGLIEREDKAKPVTDVQEDVAASKHEPSKSDDTLKDYRINKKQLMDLYVSGPAGSIAASAIMSNMSAKVQKPSGDVSPDSAKAFKHPKENFLSRSIAGPFAGMFAPKKFDWSDKRMTASPLPQAKSQVRENENAKSAKGETESANVTISNGTITVSSGHVVINAPQGILPNLA